MNKKNDFISIKYDPNSEEWKEKIKKLYDKMKENDCSRNEDPFINERIYKPSFYPRSFDKRG